MTELADLYDRFRRCMARIAVEGADPEEEDAYGAAFHIGDGWLVTADHCVKGRSIRVTMEASPFRELQVKRTIGVGMPDDLAVLETDFSLGAWPAADDEVDVGGHLDDWLGSHWVMTRYLVMGYPWTPGADRVLVADGGYVNAIVEPSTRQHSYFLISGLPRMGFSGGPVIGESGTLLGVMTDAFRSSSPSTGFHQAGAVSVQPLWDLLAANQIYPGGNGDFARFVNSITAPQPQGVSRRITR